MSIKIDPITRSVVQHRLSSIVKEMGEAMLRTSYSQILNSSRDFSLAICDTKGRLIAQADHLPVHVGALPWATVAVEERFKDIAPGDVILLLSWRDHEAADAFRRSLNLTAGGRLRQVRIVRDYGMYARQENPQYYPDVAHVD